MPLDQTETPSQSQPKSEHPHDDPTATEPPPPVLALPPPQTTATKLPFRPGKIRKLSPSTTTTTTTTTLQPITATKIPHQRVRTLPKYSAKTLSSPGEITQALQHLREADPLLSHLIETHPPPTFSTSQPPFLALTKSILYQQLAYKAGTSIYTRFLSLCGGEPGVTPESVLSIDSQQFRKIGVSTRKASYLQDLARKYSTKILSDESIVGMDDKSLFTMLTMVKGIGAWSVHMFMIFSLHRPDVLPVGDLGVRKGVQLLYGLEELPRPSQMEQLCEKWRPYRSVAVWYMWKFAEAKGVTATAAAMVGDSTQQQLQLQEQQQQQSPPQIELSDPVSSVLNLGAYRWGQ